MTTSRRTDSSLTFDALAPDGSPRKFAGMWRPPFEGWIAVPENAMRWPLWYHRDQAREVWLSGGGDRPLYEATAE